MDIQVFLHNRIHMTVNKGKGLQSFLSQSLQNVVNTQSCMKKLIIYGESGKKNNNEKDPAINFCSYHPVFVPSPLFLPCFPVTPPMHLSTLLQYFPVCVCGGKYFRPGLWGPSPSEWHWMPGRSKVGEDSLRTYGAVS